MLRLITGLLSAVFLSGCLSGPEDDSRSITNNLYRHNGIGVSIQLPASWEILLDQKFGEVKADMVGMAPVGSGITPNVNLIYRHHTGSSDMPSILAELKPQLEAAYADMKNYRDTLYQINGVRVAELFYTTASQGRLLAFNQILSVHRDNFVAITLTDDAERVGVNADLVQIKAGIQFF